MRRYILSFVMLLSPLLFAEPASSAPAPAAVIHPKPAPLILLENMTWQEVRDAIQSGKTTVIVPTGGTEQNGPAIPLGKHNFILRYTSMAIAQELGNALVAPIMPYVPEGDINPPTGHMRFPGTLSLRPITFGAFLEDTAASLRQHGFKTICFVGEHGGSQAMQQWVADKLSKEWAAEGVRVIQVSDYYDEHNGQVEWAKKTYPKEDNIEAHGGFADTSEMDAVAINPQEAVRDTLRGPYTPADMNRLGAEGSSVNATKAIGAELLGMKVKAAVAQIKRIRDQGAAH